MNPLETCKVYRVAYHIIGQNQDHVGFMEGYTLGCNVEDIVNQIKKECLGVEINYDCKECDKVHHQVCENIIMESVELVGSIFGITDAAHAMIKRYHDDMEKSDG
ncbi:MAG: hypothetical protein H7831_06665 [Magnetococcus sp. WYHC-3]